MPIIADKSGKGNPSDVAPPREGFLARIPEGALTVAVVVLASIGSFGLGVLYERESAPHDRLEIGTFEEPAAPLVLGASAAASRPSTGAAAAVPAVSGPYVASKKGSKYHLLSCPGAKAMVESNKIFFETKEAAEAAGYTPAANCKGL